LIEPREEVAHMSADGSLRMALPGLAPGEAGEKLGLCGYGTLDVVLRRESRNEL
jgi:hypothetical protein